jgi:hypothetical protein
MTILSKSILLALALSWEKISIVSTLLLPVTFNLKASFKSISRGLYSSHPLTFRKWLRKFPLTRYSKKFGPPASVVGILLRKGDEDQVRTNRELHHSFTLVARTIDIEELWNCHPSPEHHTPQDESGEEIPPRIWHDLTWGYA